MVEMADAEVGRILDALEDSRFKDNTLVIFTTDHGDGAGHHQTASKHFLYNQALMVPMVISWPGQIQEDVMDNTHLVSGLDFAPTVCDFAGIPYMPKMRGNSMRPLLEDRSADWRDHVVSECRENGRVVRTQYHKYITYYGDSTEQLFDMQKDPGETQNLSGQQQYADIQNDMKNHLNEYESQLEKIEPIRH